MNIDTEFNVGDSVCYLSGDKIYHTTVGKITIEISYEDHSFLMVYKLSDGVSVSRNNYPQWDKRLFRDKKSLIKQIIHLLKKEVIRYRMETIEMKALRIKNILNSLEEKIESGNITIREAAIELHKAGWINYIDIDTTKKLLGLN